MTVAILFCDPKGIYSTIPGCELWDAARDARKYAGPHPVVAHPPCQRWGNFSNAPKGGQQQRTGDDAGCFASAFAAVMGYCGVLEHPAQSKAWDAHGIPRPPINGGWIRHSTWSWTCHVEQGHYGHGARKATWLFFNGTTKPADLIWGPSEQRLPAKRLAERGYESARRCGAVANMSRRQRIQTPLAFAEALIALARGSKP